MFNSLDACSIYRSFPSADKLTPEAVEALQDILLYKGIPCDLSQPGTRLCYEQGWLHSEPADPTSPYDLVCVLPFEVQYQALNVRAMPCIYIQGDNFILSLLY